MQQEEEENRKIEEKERAGGISQAEGDVQCRG